MIILPQSKQKHTIFCFEAKKYTTCRAGLAQKSAELNQGLELRETLPNN